MAQDPTGIKEVWKEYFGGMLMGDENGEEYRPNVSQENEVRALTNQEIIHTKKVKMEKQLDKTEQT